MDLNPYIHHYWRRTICLDVVLLKTKACENGVRFFGSAMNERQHRFRNGMWHPLPVFVWTRRHISSVATISLLPLISRWCFLTPTIQEVHCMDGTNCKIRQSKINSRSVAGPMGQMNRQPSVWCSKYYFFSWFLAEFFAKILSIYLFT